MNCSHGAEWIAAKPRNKTGSEFKFWRCSICKLFAFRPGWRGERKKRYE